MLLIYWEIFWVISKNPLLADLVSPFAGFSFHYPRQHTISFEFSIQNLCSRHEGWMRELIGDFGVIPDLSAIPRPVIFEIASNKSLDERLDVFRTLPR